MKLNLTDRAVAKLATPTTGQACYYDENTVGFHVVVGHTGVRSFAVRARLGAKGKRVRAVIGVAGAPCGDGHRCDGDPHRCGHTWNVQLAKLRAGQLLSLLRNGINPNGDTKGEQASGPTFRDAYNAHVEKLKRKGRSESTIATIEKEIPRFMADWMDRPIGELRGSDLIALHAKIKREAKARTGTNPVNERGAPLANRVIAQVSACWNTLNKQTEGKLGIWNPAKSVERDSLKPKRERIASEDLPGWYERVGKMRNPIQRDGLVFALFTGLRSEEVRSVRFEHVNISARTLRIPDPKGGEARAFTLPLPDTCIEIIERRRKANCAQPGETFAEQLIAERGGDQGFVFPGLDGDRNVGPIADLRQQTHDGKAHGRFPVEDVHTLRRTYESVAHEEGVSEMDTHVLSNHSFASHNVNATYISQHLDHLRNVQARIEAGLWRRMRSELRIAA